MRTDDFLRQDHELRGHIREKLIPLMSGLGETALRDETEKLFTVFHRELHHRAKRLEATTSLLLMFGLACGFFAGLTVAAILYKLGVL